MSTTTTTDFDAVKQRQQQTWAAGDYRVIGTTLQLVGELVCEAVDVAAGETVLDVAAGNGNAALAAARRGAVVTASDYVPELLDGARARAVAEGATIDLRVADAEHLPFGDDAFDAVISTFGVMFTPDQERAAAEMLRVARPGGRVGLACWTPDGFIGQLFRVVGGYVPPPAGIRSPLEWGTEARVTELLGRGARVGTRTRDFVFRYRSAEHMVDTFRTYYGPTFKAFGALDANAAADLERDLVALMDAHDTAGGGSLRIPSTYLETVATVA